MKININININIVISYYKKKLFEIYSFMYIMYVFIYVLCYKNITNSLKSFNYHDI